MQAVQFFPSIFTVVTPALMAGGLTSLAVIAITNQIFKRCSSLSQESRDVRAIWVTASVAAVANVGVVYGVALSAIQHLAAISFFGGLWLGIFAALELHEKLSQVRTA